MPHNYDVVIVGGGHAGAQAAVVLRRKKFAGSIVIVGEEPDAPYDRPPLSKEYLSGEKPFHKMLFRSREKWAELGVDLRLGQRVESVETEQRCVSVLGQRELKYKNLIWAAGGNARLVTCPGSDLRGVHTVRNRSGVDRIIAELPDVRNAVVIGGGFIGLETASALTKLGKQVVLVEALDRVLARVAGEPLSRFYEEEHRSRGVEVRLGASIECIEESGGRASGVHLADGSFIPAEIVIVGIGIVPQVGPLLAAGADCANGVRVDCLCRTSIANIYAVGDCAEHQNIYANGSWVRLESVQNASDQATTAANAIAGIEEGYRAVPWFWSNQYDLLLQTVGLTLGYDNIVVRGDPRRRSFSLVYLRQGRVIALDCVNATRDYVQGKVLVANGTAADPSLLADSTSLKCIS